MYGAIIGDLAGSIYEYSQIKHITPIICNKIIEENSFISDDTILTMAILDAILDKKNYALSLREYGQRYKNFIPAVSPYFKTIFSPGFIAWLDNTKNGTSAGNGAMMRVSPIGYMFDKEEDIVKNAKLATIPSHNCTEAIDCTTTIALIIFYARKGLSKADIIKKLKLKIENKKINKFNTTCSETIDICLYVVFNSGSYEECIRNILLYGGDTDTNACIVGSMAEALYGISPNLTYEANKHIPEEFQKKLSLAYRHVKKY